MSFYISSLPISFSLGSCYYFFIFLFLSLSFYPAVLSLLIFFVYLIFCRICLSIFLTFSIVFIVLSASLFFPPQRARPFLDVALGSRIVSRYPCMYSPVHNCVKQRADNAAATTVAPPPAAEAAITTAISIFFLS